MEYDIIEAGTKEELIERVAEKIKHGWGPLGGVVVGNGKDTFYQAMTYKTKRVCVFDGEKFVENKEIDFDTYMMYLHYKRENEK